MPLKTLEQERASFAYKCVIAIKNDEKLKKEYKSLVRGFSSMILQNGLGQALAFLRAKGGTHHKKLYEHINSWLKEKFADNNNNFDVLNEIINEEGSEKYILYTKETLSFLVWLKKFTEAELSDSNKKINGAEL